MSSISYPCSMRRAFGSMTEMHKIWVRYPRPMRVRVLYFGPMKAVARKSRESVELDDDASMATLIEKLKKMHPGMKEREFAVALNSRPIAVKRTTKLHDGDEVALIPPISGGRSSFIDVRITKKKIVIEDVVASVQGEDTGAVVVFIGSVRSPSKGKKIVALEYDVYERMALAALRAIANETCEGFGVVGLSIVHRVGRVKAGETVLAIAVSSVHRDEAYKASRYVIEELKGRVPIWKKEIYEDGEEWVEGKALRGKKG